MYRKTVWILIRFMFETILFWEYHRYCFEKVVYHSLDPKFDRRIFGGAKKLRQKAHILHKKNVIGELCLVGLLMFTYIVDFGRNSPVGGTLKNKFRCRNLDTWGGG